MIQCDFKKNSCKELRAHLEVVNNVGGVVTIDIFIDEYGRWDEKQVGLLSGILGRQS